MPTPSRSRKRITGAFSAVLKRLLVVLCSLAAITLPAHAGTAHIRAELIAQGPALPGQEAVLAVLMRPEPGWHGYWLNPGDAEIGLSLNWSLPQGSTIAPLQYPTPTTLLLSDLMNHIYDRDYAVLTRLRIPANAAAGSSLTIKAQGQWLACTDKVCVPESGELMTRVMVGPPNDPDPRFDSWRTALPAPLGARARFSLSGKVLRIAIPLPRGVTLEDPHLFLATTHVAEYAAPQRFSRLGDSLIVELERARIDPIQPLQINAVLRLNQAGDGVEFEADAGTVATQGTPLVPAAAPPSLLLLVLMALAGGTLLNVMPCVFPILSLKALSLARSGESQSRARGDAIAYTAGAVIACVGLGALLLVLRASGEQIGWAFQLQEPMVVAFLLVLAAAITANLAGLFEFSVPGFAGAGSPQGAFATGLLAAFVATPCTGPFMAAAMGAALLLPAPEALALFAALGLGLALPFLALGLIPPLRAMLPRPGPWMNGFRKAMALPMALTALALLWLSSRLAGNLFALGALVAAVLVLGALALLGLCQRRGKPGGAPFVLSMMTALGLLALGLPHLERDPATQAAEALGAKPFSLQNLARARAAGKPVFLYFTADWCLTCKVNERVAIERNETRAAFEKGGVVILRGDWTRRDPVITRFLAAHGAAGVPLYLWYPARGGAVRQLPQILTPKMLEGLATAR